MGELAQAAFPTVNVVPPTAGITGEIGAWINTVVTWALGIGAIVALLFILIGGFQYLTAGDDSDQAEGARTTILNGVVGLIILASAFVIWRLLIDILNLGSLFSGI